VRCAAACGSALLAACAVACGSALLLPRAVVAGSAAGTGASAATAAPPAAFYSEGFQRTPAARELIALGRALFFDRRLSASGRLSCASCHDPHSHFGPPNAASVQRGGRAGEGEGLRAVPSLMYQQNLPPFAEHTFDDDGDDSIDQGPSGGRNWDGRAQSLHDQARGPLLSPLEMANRSEGAVAATLRRAKYAARFRASFGAQVFDRDDRALRAALLALEAFQQDPALFYPYSSKYDAWLRGRVELTPQELRGLAVFNDPARGNCARCHPSAIKNGGFPQFTDFGYAALGVPRNGELAVNADPGFFDLGLCGPLRADLHDRTGYCGMFRTPSLRNSATRRVFFHNGRLHRLVDVLRFYAERDTRPEHWYPRGADGRPRLYDDLPPAYAGNLDREPPFDRQSGDAAPFDSAETADLLAFLNTLTDGFRAGTGL
jgi:cytochrome c peroxidase